MVTRRTWQVLVVAAVLAAVALVVLGTQVRPINDDYCNARGAYTLGPIGFANERFVTWHGGWVVVVLAGVFAWPIGAHLLAVPYAAFGLATLALAGAGAVLVLTAPPAAARRSWAAAGGARSRSAPRSGPGGRATAWTGGLALAVPLGLGWLLSLIAFGSADAVLSYAGLYWQAASVVHVWPVLIFAILAGVLLRADAAPSSRLWIPVALGFGLGLFNITEGLAIAIALLLAPTLLRMTGRSRRGGAARAWYLAGLASLAGGVVIYAAPGRAAREARQPEFAAPESVADFVTGTAGGAVELAGAAIWSAGTLVALVAGYAVVRLARGAGARVTARRAVDAAVLMAALAVLLGLSVAAGQEFSYDAPYHVLAPQTAVALAALAAGAALAAADLARPIGLGVLGAGVVAAVVVAPATTAALLGFVDLVVDRLPAWEAGPAPVGFMSDIDVDVIRQCAADIDLVRP